jgi:hypothetical protein
VKHTGTRGRAVGVLTSTAGGVMLVVVLGLVQLGAASSAGAAPSQAAGPRSAAAACSVTAECSTTLGGDGANVKTANGQSWVLTVTASSSQVSVEIARKASVSPVADEIHGWTFPLKSGGLTFSTTTGIGIVKPGSRTSPYVAINLKFKATSHKVVPGACTSGSETNYFGKLTGTVRLVTGLTGGGTVTASSFTAAVSKPAVTVDKSCVAPNACLPKSTSFSDDPSPLANPSLLAEGITTSKSTDQVTISRNLSLNLHTGAYRLDESLEVVPATKWTLATKTLVVTTRASGLITGSVTISGGTKSSVQVGTCIQNGKRVHNVFTFYNPASWSSPGGRALTAHNNIGGNVAMPMSSDTAMVAFTSTT